MAEPIYQYNHSIYAKHTKRYRRRLKLLALALIIIAIAILFISNDVSKLKKQNTKSAVGATFTQHIAGPQLFRNAYFEFSSTDKWQYSPVNSSANQITYQLYQDDELAHSFTVYINQTPSVDTLAVPRVQPVQIKDDNSFRVTEAISQPCGSYYSPGQPERVGDISISGTTMLCAAGETAYTVVVGQIGGNYDLTLKRSSGQTANYIIIYRDQTFTPNTAPFLQVMQTFQAL